jgi:hypothetical protein
MPGHGNFGKVKLMHSASFQVYFHPDHQQGHHTKLIAIRVTNIFFYFITSKHVSKGKGKVVPVL